MSVIVLAGTLFDGVSTQGESDRAILLEDGLISRIGTKQELVAAAPDAEIVDATSGFVMPGLINSHAHVTFMYVLGTSAQRHGRSAAECMAHAVRLAPILLARGMTTIRDMGGTAGVPLELRRLVEAGSVRGPRILACNQPIAVTGGHGTFIAETADGATGFRRAARHQLDLGADFIKVMASHDPCVMSGPEKTRAEASFDEIAAAFEVAHDWGKKAASHVAGPTAISRVLDAGVDIIEHGHYLTAAQAERMVKQGVSYTPTLSSYDVATMHPRFRRGDGWGEMHNWLVPGHATAFQNALAAGVRILTGTDSVGSYAEEVALMRAGGMLAADTLLACTRWQAEAFGLDDRIGTLEVGKAADIVVLDGDPLADPYALESVVTVFKDGVQYDPEKLEYDESFVPADRNLRRLALHPAE